MDSVVSMPAAASGDFAADAASFSAYWRNQAARLAKLPPKPDRDAAAFDTAETIKQAARDARFAFLRVHARTLYDRLTNGRRKFVRLEQLVYEAADLVPGLAPTRAEVAAEAEVRQGEKDGCEIDQGILCNQFLADPDCGRHLCHAMLLPRPESAEALAKFQRDGHLDLGTAKVERQGKAAVLLLSNGRFLNAEDNATQVATEIGADVCILDPHSQMAVLRGNVVPHGKYAGRRVFNAGINLTHLYYGKIPFLWFLIRDLGFVNKLMRGLARPDVTPDEASGDSIEKLWISAVDTFAIGGGCQILLATDFNIAARDAYMTLPARKEGIIPGMANLRLSRFVGDRIARQAIMYERRIDCDSDVGRMICDEVVAPEDVDAAIVRVIDRLTTSGVVGATGNRRALRVAVEPFDTFRQYAAVYAREQAWCHFSPALISNLEHYWNAQSRRA
ncbi:3,5-dihydroxyphenylacetyl-CoA monooxygenase [Enhydrobacter aerosaccus]|uniref:3,5-dihydroxyphenylacetyl-CoA monooxygenase n=1 Tax=Enhydrobacter aerosaccus TaxID=225324 RepID=A0A1T4R3P9_9HYPH|nr:enoyl-CoA hydratase/isomerase family protein [Enhydrobacter aerosaccus]SKA10477.1 3,5-dihydroxyphenylacetyl-CoA monooxygenase [Enhydrobacter aerosaccus]